MDRQFKQFDNIGTKVVDDLRKTLQESRGCVLSVAAASFSIYAFEALKEELEGIKELRFIFTSPTFIKDKVTKEKKEFYIPRLQRESAAFTAPSSRSSCATSLPKRPLHANVRTGFAARSASRRMSRRA